MVGPLLILAWLGFLVGIYFLVTKGWVKAALLAAWILMGLGALAPLFS